MKVLFLDCSSGISGDMTVGALCDLGVKPSTLEWELSKLDLGDFHMHFERQQRRNIEGIKFGIHEGAVHSHGPDDECAGHTHEHEDSHEHHHHGEGEHGHSHPHSHDEHTHAEHTHEHGEECHHHEHGHEPAGSTSPILEHDHEHGDEVAGARERHEQEHADSHAGSHEDGHSHEHGHTHEHAHEHEHVHGRSHREIRALIEASELSPFVKKHALGIFQRIAEAEGKIHGMPAENVGFHEVGALDSIADIVCACVGIEALGVGKVFISRLNDGHGWVDCAHGRFPLPAPATLEILKGIPIRQIEEEHELITPTGAAIAAEFAASFGLMPSMVVEKIGYGLGQRDLAARPNVLRAVLGELTPEG